MTDSGLRVDRKRLTLLEWVILVTLLIGAFWLRVVRFSDLPPGVIHDEVRDWLNAQLLLGGDIRALYPYGEGREALYIFLEAFFLKLLGDNLLAIRFPSIAFSLIGIVSLYSMSRHLLGRRVALAASAGWGSSFWALMFARLAQRPGLLPGMALLTIYAYLHLLRSTRRSWMSSLTAGFLFGLTLYTYPAALILPLLLVLWLGAIWTWNKPLIQDRMVELAVSFVLAGLLAIPLFKAWNNPDATRRADLINAPLESLQEGDIGPILKNIPAVLGGFTVQGDPGSEFNIPGQPLIPTFPMAIFFYLGLLWATTGLFDKHSPYRIGYVLVLLWLALMLVPTLATERPVNSYRTIGMMAAVYILPGIAFDRAMTIAGNKGQLRQGILIVLIAGLGIQGWVTINDYFSVWYKNPVVRFLYQDEYRQIAGALDDNWIDNSTLWAIGGLTPDELDPSSLRLLVVNDQIIDQSAYFDPQTSLIIPPAPQCVLIPSFITLHPELAPWLQNGRPAISKGIPHDVEHCLEPYEGLPDGYIRVERIFDELVSLDGVRYPLPLLADQPLTILTLWKTSKPSLQPLRIFLHVIDIEGNIIAQSDGLGVPATQWREGDIFIQAHDLTIPSDSGTPVGIRIGLYNPETGIRVPLEGGTGDEIVVSLAK